MQSMRIPEPHNAEGAMHLSDTALGAVFDPAGGGERGAAARAHAADCAECGRAMQDARTADREVADALCALDHPLPPTPFSVIVARAAQPDITSDLMPGVMRGWLRASGSRPAMRRIATLVVATSAVALAAALAAVPRSPVRHLVAAWVALHHQSGTPVPVASPPPSSTPGPPAATTPRGIAIIARGHLVLTFRLPQPAGAIRLTIAPAPDPRGPRVSVLASGDGVTYLVSRDTIAIDNRAALNLDYDVALPPPSQLPVVSIRVAGRVIFARRGASIQTTGINQSGTLYSIPLSVAEPAAP